MEEDRRRNEVRLIGLVETHEKYNNVRLIEKMRDMEDKKGGGLMILTNDLATVEMEGQNCNSNDILVARVEIWSFSFLLVLVYLDTRDIGRNGRIYEELNGIMNRLMEGEACLIMGDFNGHVGYLGEQELNRNGDKMLDFMES